MKVGNSAGAGRGSRKTPAASASYDPADYYGEALETLDALLAGPLGGGLGAGELQDQFPVIRAALRQIRSDLDRAGSWRGHDERVS